MVNLMNSVDGHQPLLGRYMEPRESDLLTLRCK